jgi:hypothetical protein
MLTGQGATVRGVGTMSAALDPYLTDSHEPRSRVKHESCFGSFRLACGWIRLTGADQRTRRVFARSFEVASFGVREMHLDRFRTTDEREESEGDP